MTQRSLRGFKRILKHYFILALEKSGVTVNSDILAELDGCIIDLERAIREIVKEEVMKNLCVNDEDNTYWREKIYDHMGPSR